MNQTIEILEFNKIKDMLYGHAVSDKGKGMAANLELCLEELKCIRNMRETTEAKLILDALGLPPLGGMKDLERVLTEAESGSMLMPEQLEEVGVFLTSCKRMKSYLKRSAYLGVSMSACESALHSCNELKDLIETSIRNHEVADGASPALSRIRRDIEGYRDKIRAKLEQIMRGKKDWFADQYISQRNGHYVLPLKKEYKNQLECIVYDTSSSGGTCFVEPAAVAKLQKEVLSLEIEEENEIRRILYCITDEVAGSLTELRINMDMMGDLDFAFAKAKLSLQMKAVPVPIGKGRKIIIKNGRHPLLKVSTCVPLNFKLGEEPRGIVITGPNTGGKTVALKTVGLLSMMAQCGLHIPADDGSEFCMHSQILCDIGDGQSIEQNLSTFSSHIVNIVSILNHVNQDSLVILDELGSGTDPAEGMGIAISILEALKASNCLFLATTHYPEVKEYAELSESCVNARMSFDRESLKPLYSLIIGEAGESCAMYIAEKLGFPKELLSIAEGFAYKEDRAGSIEASYQKIKSEKKNVNLRNSKVNAPRVVGLPKNKKTGKTSFSIGDSVLVYPNKEKGIVCQKENEKGEIGVQIRGRKKLYSYKRIKLLVSAHELYPDDYDFSIVFDSVENRKAAHTLGKRYDPLKKVEYLAEDNFKWKD